MLSVLIALLAIILMAAIFAFAGIAGITGIAKLSLFVFVTLVPLGAITLNIWRGRRVHSRHNRYAENYIIKI